MTHEEAMMILAILKAAYPNSYKNVTVEDANSIAAIWAVQFANIPAKLVLIAANKWIATNPFPPAISELKKKVESLYWEAWELLNANKRNKSLTPEQVEEYKQIYEVAGSLRSKASSEPSLLEITASIKNLLPGDERKAIGGC